MASMVPFIRALKKINETTVINVAQTYTRFTFSLIQNAQTGS